MQTLSAKRGTASCAAGRCPNQREARDNNRHGQQGAKATRKHPCGAAARHSHSKPGSETRRQAKRDRPRSGLRKRTVTKQGDVTMHAVTKATGAPATKAKETRRRSRQFTKQSGQAARRSHNGERIGTRTATRNGTLSGEARQRRTLLTYGPCSIRLTIISRWPALASVRFPLRSCGYRRRSASAFAWPGLAATAGLPDDSVKIGSSIQCVIDSHDG